MNTKTSDTLARLRELLEEITPGPWFREGAPYYDQHRWITVNAPDGQLAAMGGPNREDVLSQNREKADATFIAEARNALPDLLEIAIAAKEVIDRTRHLPAAPDSPYARVAAALENLEGAE